MCKIKYRRLLSVLLCMVMVCCLSVPAFAASDDLGFQYVFEKYFLINDFSDQGNGWYKITLDVAPSADTVKADYVTFSVDDYVFTSSFKSASRSVTYHYIGNGYDVMGFGEDTDDPYLLIICPEDSSRNALYLKSEIFSPLFHGDTYKVHIALSEGHNHLFVTGDFLDNVTSVFTSAIGMVATSARTVISHPILLVPIVVGLVGLGIAFYRRLKH